MDAEPKKSKSTDGEKRKRKSTTKKDEKKGRGKQRKKDDSVEDKSTEQPTQEKEGGSPTRPSSPENCSICLGDLQNKSFTDSCFHMFCFVCLREWSKVKAECPLCKQKFKNIIYNVKSYEKYDRYNIEEQNNRNQQFEGDERRFRYRTTFTFERRFTIGSEHDYTQPIARPSNRPTNVTTRSNWRRFREPATSDFRRRVYQNGMRATDVADRRLRVRDTTPQFFSRNPAQMHRLVPWLNRELNALLQNQPQHVELLMEIVMGTIKRYPIDSEEFYQHVYPYIGRNTRHFMHEFSCFAKSPYNMPTYDAHVNYQERNHTDNTISTDDTDDDFDNEIIDIEEESDEHRSPPLPRRGVHPFSNLTGWSSLLRGYDDLFDTNIGTRSLRMPLSMSGWDSPTPGPSWDAGALDFSGSLSVANVPVESNRASSPIDIGTSSDSDTDSTDSAESTNSDIVFVKMDKPWQERSPIMLSSDGSDVERNLSLDFQRKHYFKKKTHIKKKKHKEHKKHNRENSNERKKHRKHRKHKTSEKTTEDRDSCSKSQDSSGYPSSSSSQKDHYVKFNSSKHKERKRSSSKSIDRDSHIIEKHHKKHKKRKRDEEKKSYEFSGKLKSVIVKPTATAITTDMSSSKSSSYSPSLKSSPTSSSKSSGSKINDRGDRPYKKHFSGHKRSGKLSDIVPKLIGNKLIQFSSNTLRKEESATAESQQLNNETTTTSSVEKDNSCTSFLTVGGSSGNLDVISDKDDSNLGESSSYKKSDTILSLDNSRRCMKCNLLYIPELLDLNGICFTCKRKHACETTTRSFSDAFRDLPLPSIPFNSYINNLNRRNQSTSGLTHINNSNLANPTNTQIDLSSDDSSVNVSDSDSDGCQIITSKTASQSQESNSLGVSSVKRKKLYTLSRTTSRAQPRSHSLSNNERLDSMTTRPQVDCSSRSSFLTHISAFTLEDRLGVSSSSIEINSSLNPIPLNVDDKDQELNIDDQNSNTRSMWNIQKEGFLNHTSVQSAGATVIASHYSRSQPSSPLVTDYGPLVKSTLIHINQNTDDVNVTSLTNFNEEEEEDVNVTSLSPVNEDDDDMNVTSSISINEDGNVNVTSLTPVSEEDDVNVDSLTPLNEDSDDLHMTSLASVIEEDVNVTSLSSDEGPLIDIEIESDDCEITHYTEKFDSPDQHNSTFNKNLGAEEEVTVNNPLEKEEFPKLSQDPLRIDFSNPATPVKSLESDIILDSLKSSPSLEPWSLDVSNPPTLTSDHWPGYMAPKPTMIKTSPLVFNEDQLNKVDTSDNVADEEMTDRSTMPTLNELNTDQRNLHLEEKKEKATSDSDLSDSEGKCEETRQLPSSLNKKLEGLTDFSNNVLQEMKKHHRLTLHNILSRAKSDSDVGTKCSITDSKNCDTLLNATVSSNTSVTDRYIDSLIVDMGANGNKNCCDEIELENMSVNSSNGTSSLTLSDKAPPFTDISSPISASSDQQNDIHVPVLPSEESLTELGSFIDIVNSVEQNCDIAMNSESSQVDNLVDNCITESGSDRRRFGDRITSIDNQPMLSDGQPNNETSNYFSDSDHNSHDETIDTSVHNESLYEYRVDILHSNEELTNIFENDDCFNSN